MNSWDRVEEFRQKHGHLPSESSAPCVACFKERTEAKITIMKLEEKLRSANDVIFNAEYLFGQGHDLRDLRMAIRDHRRLLKKNAEIDPSPSKT